ncbi:MAG: c-type cytochrome [Pseudomonadota bacterium]
MTPIKTLSALALLLASGLVQASEAAAPAGDAAAGKAKAAQCVACHGADGNSAVTSYPRLAGQGARYLAKQLHDFKSGKRANPVMMGMAGPLSEQDILDLAAYYSEQKSGTAAADPALAKAAEKVWRGGNLESGVLACTGCHGPSGRGNYLAGFPALRGQHADYVEAQLKAFRAAARGDLTGDKRENDPEGIMRGVAKHLSDTEIKGLAQFVSGLYQ